MSWRPILDGAPAEAAHEAIRAIGDSLADSVPLQAVAENPVVAARHATLASGRAGFALFYAYRERAGHGGHGVAGQLLGEAIERAASAEMGPSLCEGITGVGWAALHLTGANPDAEALQRHVSANLLLTLERPATPDARVDYDLLYGLVGFGVYALERLPEPGAVVLLERIVDRLEQLAEHRADMITW